MAHWVLALMVLLTSIYQECVTGFSGVKGIEMVDHHIYLLLKHMNPLTNLLLGLFFPIKEGQIVAYFYKSFFV